MSKGGGVIPPGRAGLLVLAVAMVPVAIRRFPRAVRWIGKQLETTGLKVQRTVEETDRFESERQARAQAEASRVEKSRSARQPSDVIVEEAEQSEEVAATHSGTAKAEKKKSSGKSKKSKA